jgi:hypothetical protein
VERQKARLKRFLVDVAVACVVGALSIGVAAAGYPQVGTVLVVGLIIYLVVTGIPAYRDLFRHRQEKKD